MSAQGGALATLGKDAKRFYTEGVGQFQPRVCFKTLGIACAFCFGYNPERVATGLGLTETQPITSGLHS